MITFKRSVDDVLNDPNIPQEAKDAVRCIESCHCAYCVFVRMSYKNPAIIEQYETEAGKVGAYIINEAAKRADN